MKKNKKTNSKKTKTRVRKKRAGIHIAPPAYSMDSGRSANAGVQHGQPAAAAQATLKQAHRDIRQQAGEGETANQSNVVLLPRAEEGPLNTPSPNDTPQGKQFSTPILSPRRATHATFRNPTALSHRHARHDARRKQFFCRRYVVFRVL